MGSSDEEESTATGEINPRTAASETAENKPYKYHDPVKKEHPDIIPPTVKQTPAKTTIQYLSDELGQGNRKRFRDKLARIKEEREKSSS